MPATTFAVEPKGVGRKDYSSGTEMSVEPVIRSYQDVYSHFDTVTVPAGATVVKDVSVDLGFVVLLYDYFAAIPSTQLVSLSVRSVTAGIAARFLEVSKHGSITEHISKGVPFFETVRFSITNSGAIDVDVTFGAVGIITSRENYYLLSVTM